MQITRTVILLACCWISVSPAEAATETPLHNFGIPAQGAYPIAGLIRDSSGNFYGTTTAGGASGYGAVYKVDSSGHNTVLYSFTGAADGGNPYAAVTRDGAGNLYGTTYYGGAASGTLGFGVVYKLDTTGHETVLYTFTGGTDGSNPIAGVVRDSAGNLYGTTYQGGNSGYGVVYKIDTAGQYSVLYRFIGVQDGGNPVAGVILDAAGNLYGTTLYGGLYASATGYGVVYKITPGGIETVLYTFTGGPDGGRPYAALTRDSAGNLYGTASTGGNGYGAVYKIDTTGHEATLYGFSYGADGQTPEGGVIRDSSGNLYGTTITGGAAGQGVVYRIDTSGNETVLYSFSGGADGANSIAGVIRDASGNLYGTTEYGGAGSGALGFGVLYKIDTANHEKVLYTFPQSRDGQDPFAGVIRDSAGNLYGTTLKGGASDNGTVYKVDPAGQETVLYSFTGGSDGSLPYSGLIRDSAGNLYGTTEYGGIGAGFSGHGVAYKLDPTGHESVLYTFTGGTDGGHPFAGVIRDSNGSFYGTASSGGVSGWGVVYKLDTTGHQTVLYSFTGGLDGGLPVAGVIRDPAGNLYGTTQFGGSFGVSTSGVVYKLDATGQETVLHAFTGYSDGANPIAGVIRDSAGNLYGTTEFGGDSFMSTGHGVVYKVDTAGNQTVLYTFTGGADGAYPNAGVTRDSSGNLFSTTTDGGASGFGVVYKLDTTGHQQILYSFPGGVNGGNPYGGVITDSAGNMYGTTASRGLQLAGVVFKLTP